MSETDKRFGKPRCTVMVKPTPSRGAQDRNPPERKCGYPEFKDGFCKKHHPEEIAARKAEQDRRNEEWELHQREEKAERLKALENKERGALTVENAIVLLVQNGYRVEKVTPNAELTRLAEGQSGGAKRNES